MSVIDLSKDPYNHVSKENLKDVVVYNPESKYYITMKQKDDKFIQVIYDLYNRPFAAVGPFEKNNKQFFIYVDKNNIVFNPNSDFLLVYFPPSQRYKMIYKISKLL